MKTDYEYLTLESLYKKGYNTIFIKEWGYCLLIFPDGVVSIKIHYINSKRLGEGSETDWELMLDNKRLRRPKRLKSQVSLSLNQNLETPLETLHFPGLYQFGRPRHSIYDY